MIRTPKTTAITGALLLVLIFLIALHPMFDTRGETTLAALLADDPLVMSDYPAALREILDEETRDRMRDRWGFLYPPSGSVDLSEADLRPAQERMDRALEQYENGRFRRALTILDEDYNAYIQAVLGGTDRADPLPQSEDELVLYGLYRYNRAFGLFAMAGGLRRGDPRRAEFLKMALYDLRRAVGAFESLGKAGDDREPYWGTHYHAWEGSSLDRPGHAHFPIHQVYANLSTAYLRVEDLPDYPEVQTSYMRGERDKYRLSDSELSAIVSSLVNSCLSQRKGLNPVKFRLTMALQNLEAASRGMKQGNEARFNYMIGIILSHLQGLDEQVTYTDAIGFLELAAGDRAAGSSPRLAAQKELALIYLIVGNDDRALATLGEIDPSELKDVIAGTDKDYGLLFTDIAQYAHLARGDLSRTANHLTLRQSEFKTGKSEARVEELHDHIVATLASAFAKGLYQRCRTLIGQGRIAEVSHLLRSLDAELQPLPVFHQAFHKHCYGRARWSPSLRINLALEQNSGWATFFAWAPLLLSLALLLLLADFYRAQRRVARKLFQPGYRHDMKN